MKISRFLPGMLLLVCFSLIASIGFALDPYFLQNGDCYLLVGDGPYRGVYALNNLTGSGISHLYDPFEAYGLTAAQKYESGSTEKRLYTFSSTDTGWETESGLVPRKVLVNASNNVYGPGVVPPYIVHRYHGSPFNSPTGHGNHPQATLNWKFSGFDYPCSKVPAPSAGKPGYYDVQMGKFYHAADRPVHSPYVYGGYQSNLWVHWVVRENGTVKYRNLKLYEYNINTKTGPTIISNLPKVKIEEKINSRQAG